MTIKFDQSYKCTPKMDSDGQPLALKEPKYLILHCSGFSLAYLLKIWADSKVGAHYLIPAQQDLKAAAPEQRISNFFKPTDKKEEEAYPVFELLTTKSQVAHAGVSYWQTDKNLNDQAVGVEVHLPDYANALAFERNEIAQTDFNYFADCEPEQITALLELIQHILHQHPSIQADAIWSHSDIAPWRETENGIVQGKTDPGATFPWQQLAQYGFGVWPKEERTRKGELPKSLAEVKQLLSTIGYNTGEDSNVWDAKAFYAIKAFLLHFLPEHYATLPHDFRKFNQITSIEKILDKQALIYLENLSDEQYAYRLFNSSNFTPSDPDESLRDGNSNLKIA